MISFVFTLPQKIKETCC